MNPKLKKLYQDVILHHHKNPVNFQKKENFPVVLEANNPLCGDRYTLYLEVNNNKITEVYFYGFGCAISKASTSILVETLVGKTIEEAKKHCEKFIQHVDGENRENNRDSNFSAFEAVDDFPARRSCAILAWEILNEKL